MPKKSRTVRMKLADLLSWIMERMFWPYWMEEDFEW